mmetsp:Transcript_10416/g.11310  ORF Transcript_10416/g.11310 Transcript_10416/m.11310 type:complete len:263 (-) Transcript_10416:233-1021(-)
MQVSTDCHIELEEPAGNLKDILKFCNLSDDSEDKGYSSTLTVSPEPEDKAPFEKELEQLSNERQESKQLATKQDSLSLQLLQELNQEDRSGAETDDSSGNGDREQISPSQGLSIKQPTTAAGLLCLENVSQPDNSVKIKHHISKKKDASQERRSRMIKAVNILKRLSVKNATTLSEKNVTSFNNIFRWLRGLPFNFEELRDSRMANLMLMIACNKTLGEEMNQRAYFLVCHWKEQINRQIFASSALSSNSTATISQSFTCEQ